MVRLVDRLAAVLAILSGLLVLLLALFIGFDVIARRFLGFSLQGSDELGGYVLAIVGSLGLAYVQAERGFTRIDLALPYYPAPIRRALHVLAYLTLAGFAVFMAWYALGEFQETWRFDSRASTPLQTPLWIPQGLWLAGMIIFAVSAVSHAVLAARYAVSAPGTLEHVFGGRTIEDEFEEFKSTYEITEELAACPPPPQRK
jgi:TRAP-type C4-dicarboxylate transport system permease small subunit